MAETWRKGTSGTWCTPRGCGMEQDTGRMAGESPGVQDPVSPTRAPCLSSAGPSPLSSLLYRLVCLSWSPECGSSSLLRWAGSSRPPACHAAAPDGAVSTSTPVTYRDTPGRHLRTLFLQTRHPGWVRPLASFPFPC
uniref:Uncharacterized protein n=1 Tax=Chelydra serpentina TaxID=8475 RepID=A0A8C3T4Z2_CHESE